MEHKLFTYTEEEIRETVLSLYPRITAYIRGFSKGRLSADDVFQDVLCKFIATRPEVYEDNVASYLYRSVRNTCLNLLTRNNVEHSSISISDVSAQEFDTLAMLDFESYLPDETELPDIGEILNFSNEFSDRTRCVFRLSRIEGMTHKEIAELLGISTRAVEKHLSKSVSDYRQHFGFCKEDKNIKIS